MATFEVPSNGPMPPTLATPTATSTTTSTVTLNGTITSLGNASATVEGFNYGTSTSYGSVVSSTGTFGTGVFSENLTGLMPNTTYHVQAYATNSIGEGTSSDANFTTNAVPQTPSFIQTNNAVPSTAKTSVTVTYTSAQTAGDLNVVAIGWYNTTTTISSVTDSKGNSYLLAAGITSSTPAGSLAIYYAPNIASSSAASNTVTVTFNTSSSYPDVRIAEYSGVNTTSPLDVTSASSSSANATSSTSGFVTTTNANDLLVGANYVTNTTNSAGTGYTKRVITSPDGDILEDRVVTSTGSYSATANTASGAWVMQMAAFEAE
jgi:hypothetical protein